MTITVYSTGTSTFSKMLKDFLLAKNITFTEKDITEKQGYRGIPLTVVKKDDGSETEIIGFDQQKLEEVVK